MFFLKGSLHVNISVQLFSLLQDEAGDGDDWDLLGKILDKIRTIIWNITVFCFVCYAGMYLF